MDRAIIGVGNVLMMDEGVGVHCVRAIAEDRVPKGVMIFDGGTEGYGLIDVISDLDRLVIIDCVKGGERAGTIYSFDPSDVGIARDRYQASIHQAGICEVLDAAALVGKRPRTTVIGVEPKTLEIGMDLSQVLRGRLGRVIELALEAVTDEGT